MIPRAIRAAQLNTCGTDRELLFQSEQNARSRREPVHFPTEGLFLSRVGGDPNQFPASLPEMNAKLE
jgi:hypothetical protein